MSYVPGGSPLDAALRNAQHAVRQAPGDAQAYAQLGAQFLKRKRSSNNVALVAYAQDALDAAARRAPLDEAVQSLRVMLLLDSHRFGPAAELAATLVSAHPDDPTLQVLLGDALLELGDEERAMEVYQTAVDLRPDLRTYNRAAYMLWLLDDVDGAFEAIRRAVEAGNPRDPESLAFCMVDAGTWQWQLGRHAKALAAADRALQLIRDYVPALRLKGRALTDAEDLPGAIAAYERAVELSGHVEETLELAELVRRAGDAPRAEALVSGALLRRNEEPRAAALFLARHGLEPGDALRLIGLDLKDRHNIHSLSVQALALLRAGQPREADVVIRKATRFNTPDARAHLHDALIRMALKDVRGARAALARADALHPRADPLLQAEIERHLATVRR